MKSDKVTMRILAVLQCFAVEIYCKVLVVLLILVALMGCKTSKPLDEPEMTDGYAELTIDWSDGAQIRPARLLFYDEEGELVKNVAVKTGEFKGLLPIGTYRLIVHNTDAKQVEYRGIQSYATAAVHAKEMEEDQMRGMPSILQPREVFGAGRCKEFSELKIVAGETLKATVIPTLLTKAMRLQFGGPDMENIQSVTGMLYGVLSGIFFASGNFDTSSVCSVEFEAEPQMRSSGNYGTEISFFNLATKKDSPAGTNVIELTITDTNGVKHTSTVDITEVLKESIEGNNGDIPTDIPIDMDVELKPIEGFVATVKPWDVTGTGGGDPRPNK